eukprot:656647-Alexandrium_andersonii.AAC.1
MKPHAIVCAWRLREGRFQLESCSPAKLLRPPPADLSPRVPIQARPPRARHAPPGCRHHFRLWKGRGA